MLDVHDHRALGQRQGLFHFQDEAPGMVFWHPRGWQLMQRLEAAVRRHTQADGFAEVRTPQLMRAAIWQASGHWQSFAQNMFKLEDGGMPAALKPVSCPGHIQVAQPLLQSYRALPLRLAEFGQVHRAEPAGTLHGLFRLRQFTQDDGHIFCALPQVQAEVERFCHGLQRFYRAFGFAHLQVAFSSRPAERVGSDAIWDSAEAMLLAAAHAAGLAPGLQPGQGAFYGPKLEFSLCDRLGRHWQCGTIQLDFVMPERFGLHYADAAGERQVPAMLHRAMLGSLERFLGILLEHHRGVLPAWLAVDPVVIVPVAPAQADYAAEVQARCAARGVGAVMDARSESLGRRIADAHGLGTNFVVVVGAREQEGRALALRAQGPAVQRKQWTVDLEPGVEALAQACAAPV